MSMGDSDNHDDDNEQQTTTATIFANKAQIFQFTQTHTLARSLIDRENRIL